MTTDEGSKVGYPNYTGVSLAQTDAAYEWLTDPRQQPWSQAGIDTAKIWQSYTLPAASPVANLIVFGDGNYAAGNDAANVIKADAARVLIYGGRGEDVFVGSGGSGTTFIVAQGEGDKVVQNFTGADTVRLIGGPLTSFEAVKANMVQQGTDVALNDGGTMILFRNASLAQFGAQNFQLPLDRASLGAPTFSEEFDDPSTIGTRWQTNYGYAGDGLNSFTLPQNGEQQIYTSAGFHGTAGAPLGLNPYAFGGGVLSLKATPVSDAQAAQMWGYRYSSGMIQSTFTQTYGYFEVRAELPHGQGLWPAFWLLGEQNKEIDVLEGLGSDTKVAYNALHSPWNPALGNASFNPYADGFHEYGVMWKPDSLTYYVDGTPVWQTANPGDLNSPMKMIVNLAVGGNWPGSPDGSTPWPAEMKIDYVKAWSLPDPNYHPPVDSGPAPTPGPAPSPAGGVLLTSQGYGDQLQGGAGDDTLNAGQGPDRLSGGAGADVFAFKALPWNAGHIADFQVGIDRLDLSALYAGGYHGADPVADGYVSLVADGAGGTRVMLDPDAAGSANPWPYAIVTLDGVSPAGVTAAQLFGGGAAPAPAPAGSGEVLTSQVYGAHLTGGAGADTLNAGQGPDQLAGGAGADHFVFAKSVWNAGHVTDFQPGVDAIDLRPLFAQAGYHGSDPVADGYLRLAGDGAGGTTVAFDADGWGSGNPWPTTITTLDHVAPSSLSGADWLFR
jgi:beta-glucanase (GH16 family)